MQHGATPKIEEYDENGACVMRAWFGRAQSTQSYRAYRFLPWTGCPRTKPDVFACLGEQGKTAVYVSWNGATDVQAWRVRDGSSGNGTVSHVAPRNGFETRVVVEEGLDKVIVEAVGGMGDGIKSEVVTVGERC